MALQLQKCLLGTSKVYKLKHVMIQCVTPQVGPDLSDAIAKAVHLDSWHWANGQMIRHQGVPHSFVWSNRL